MFTPLCLDFPSWEVKPMTILHARAAVWSQEPGHMQRTPTEVPGTQQELAGCQGQSQDARGSPRPGVVRVEPTLTAHSGLSRTSTCGMSLSNRPFLGAGLCFKLVKQVKGEGQVGRGSGGRGGREGIPTR